MTSGNAYFAINKPPPFSASSTACARFLQLPLSFLLSVSKCGPMRELCWCDVEEIQEKFDVAIQHVKFHAAVCFRGCRTRNQRSLCVLWLSSKPIVQWQASVRLGACRENDKHDSVVTPIVEINRKMSRESNNDDMDENKTYWRPLQTPIVSEWQPSYPTLQLHLTRNIG